MRDTLSVLMYHAIPEGAGGLAGADAHYAVDLQRFGGQLDQVLASGRPVLDIASLPHLAAPARTCPSVAISFDDGHGTNALAAQALAERQLTATFFVNPSTVGTPGMLSWAALADMAAAGMSIQSHGFHHRFLNDLSTDEVRAELTDSRRAIEDRLGRGVTVFAPPGGRVVPGLDRLALAAGYRMVCTSAVGVWSMTSGSPWAVPRFAVLAATSDRQLMHWVLADRRELWRQHARHGVLQLAKRVLGNERYVRWRGTVVAGETQA